MFEKLMHKFAEQEEQRQQEKLEKQKTSAGERTTARAGLTKTPAGETGEGKTSVGEQDEQKRREQDEQKRREQDEQKRREQDEQKHQQERIELYNDLNSA
ncbi:hypothetical protein WA026_014122 [Henosepilachna vigintioctopunctata]|uniref:Uncharacterized protein n=1 Tax=Henosepilachna vigintioctopunctata TaxID=420089 RepID=A0AAW1TTI3_9CUCU